MKRLLAYLLVHRSKKKDRNLAALEARQAPNGSPFFNDSFYFCGRDAAGTSLVFRLGFRPAQKTELWCDLIIPGVGRFHAPSSGEPDSGLFGCGGLRFACLEPARAWSISFSGPMETGERTAKVDVELAFEADAEIVDFGVHGDSWSLAGYLASQR